MEATADSFSNDLQTVHTTISLQFHVIKDFAPEIYKSIGSKYKVIKSILEPAIQESIKAVTADYPADDLVIKRVSVKSEIKEAIDMFISDTLESKGIAEGLSISNLAVTNFQFSDDFNIAIENKVKAEQEALKALNDKQKTIVDAEASAEEMMIRANASAYRIRELGSAKAYAIQLEGMQLKNNPELVKLRVTEMWNGVLSQVQGANSTSFLDNSN